MTDDRQGQAAGESLAIPVANESRAIPPQRYDLRILQSLRRIIRAVDLFSHKLASEHKITAPQLVCLITVIEQEGLTVSQLSQAIFLSASTVVGILDRLERRGLLERKRSTTDRRQVQVFPTDAGRELVDAAPSPLQTALAEGLANLPDDEQRAISESIEGLVAMLEIRNVDAAPLLDTGSLADDAAGSQRLV